MKAVIKNPPKAKKKLDVPKFADLAAGDMFAFPEEPNEPCIVTDSESYVRLKDGYHSDCDEEDEIILLDQTKPAEFTVRPNPTE